MGHFWIECRVLSEARKGPVKEEIIENSEEEESNVSESARSPSRSKSEA